VPIPDFIVELRRHVGTSNLWLPGVTAVVRRGPEILLVRRSDTGEWTPVTGIVDPGEDPGVTARREVLEETGMAVVLGRELGEARYTDNRGRPKIVRYWLMTLDPDESGPGFAPNHEVDELRWCSIAEAARLLTYAHDQALLSHAAEGLGTTP
jgi:8-oxo-dGTP pyrophosphatase MutT (NUDIX family)